jgi:hypothetical protein
LERDPFETTNVIREHNREASNAREQISKTYQSDPKSSPQFSYEDETEIMERLRSLGYV